MDERVERVLGDRYAIRRVLGVGGAATVYLADDLKHARSVAVKVLRPEVAASLGVERFVQEIGVAARLTHPNILALHDSGEAGGFLYYVMPYVEGETLRGRLNRTPQLPLEEAVTIACEVAGALDYAHRHDVIHRDVKPENILFQDGHAAVTDFGVARAITKETLRRLTDAGLAVGTPEYMSPEACAGEAVDGRGDEYSLACMLYEMLAGRPPFTAATPHAVIARHLVDQVPPLCTVRPDTPANVARAIARALAKAPADRFPTLQAFADALRNAAAADETAQRSVAVLPFTSLSGLAEDEVLSDGITEEIIAALTRIGSLRVASRTSVFVFKGKPQDVRGVGAQLHVGAVLEGSLQRSGSRLRVSAQLVNVGDGYLLWSERYDREMADVFAIQDEIAHNIARALKVILSDAEREALGGGRVPTRDIRAYEYYLKGRQFLHQARRKSLQFAEEMFRRAIALDAAYAQAWAGLADTCSLLDMFYPGACSDPCLGDQASAKALALNPDLPEAHAARGFALWQAKHVDEAVAEFEEAMRLDPRQFEARYYLARLRFQQGDIAAAAELFEAAAQAREDADARFFAAQSYAALGRAAEAEAAYRRALAVVEQHLELNPDDSRAATMCAVALCRLGEKEKGLEWANRARAIDPDDAGILYNVACLFALEGRKDDALACLEQAFKAGFGDWSWIVHDPDLESLRDDARFTALLPLAANP